MDPGFHRGDDKAEMMGTRVDFQSTNSEPLGLEPRGVQLWRAGFSTGRLISGVKCASSTQGKD